MYPQTSSVPFEKKFEVEGISLTRTILIQVKTIDIVYDELNKAMLSITHVFQSIFKDNFGGV
ncbi:MAG: hypothetical protein C0424_09490 [Sphingobacteriaceae bacterium]|nr:hypothetical protein [Sphingobacteriaceae bacterium]